MNSKDIEMLVNTKIHKKISDLLSKINDWEDSILCDGSFRLEFMEGNEILSREVNRHVQERVKAGVQNRFKR